MKPDIHPAYHKLNIIMTDGTEFVTGSTSNQGKLLLDVDFRKHAAWTGGVSEINSSSSKVAAFNSKFSGLSFSTKKKEEEK